MKVCPGCGSYCLYDDDKTVCPNCGSLLVSLRKKPKTEISEEATSPLGCDLLSNADKYVPQKEEFEVIDGRNHAITGIITEINNQTRVHNRFKKIINAITRGEPYQFGHTTHETIIRIAENKLNGFATRSRDVFFYGDVEGRFVIGDEIKTTAREVKDRLVVSEVYNRSTDSVIKPTAQLSVAIIGILAALMALAIVLFIWLIASGTIFHIIGVAIGGLLGIVLSLLTALAPLILCILVIRYMLR